MSGWLYMLASKKGGTIYTGVTSDLPHRVWEHKERLTPGFTTRYGVKRLVWYEEHPYISDAIRREKAMKSWPRAWKVALIEKENPGWGELASHLVMF